MTNNTIYDIMVVAQKFKKKDTGELPSKISMDSPTPTFQQEVMPATTPSNNTIWWILGVIMIVGVGYYHHKNRKSHQNDPRVTPKWDPPGTNRCSESV